MMSNIKLGIPSPEILYDKIIDVELISMERNNDVVHIISGDDSLDPTTKGITVVPEDIIIYKGFSHMEYYIDDLGIVHSSKIKAVGSPIYIDSKTITSAQAQKEGVYNKAEGGENWWVNKSIQAKIKSQLATSKLTKLVPKKSNIPVSLTKGVCIIVNNNGKHEKFHAIYSQQDDDQTTRMHVTDILSIKCADGGIKPSISFTTNVIPGNNCYKMTLKIFNMNLNYDIRKIKTVRITAGYRTQGYQTRFICPVFSSYIESPNPDGVTVFECLCVGRCESFASNSPVNFHYLGGKITLKDFIAETARGLGESVVVHNYLKDSYKNLEMHITERMDTYFENGASTLAWMRNMIQKRIAAAEGFVDKPQEGSDVSYPYIMCTLGQEGDLFVYALNRENSDTQGKDENILLKDIISISTIPKLDTVKGASFNGVALSVKSLWDPRVKPGELFQMYANIYNGANLPNTLSPIQFGGDDSNMHLYRCITCSVAFSTNDAENEMSILAVPVIYMEDSAFKNLDFVDTFDKFVTTALSTYNTRNGKDVYYGKAETVVQTTSEQQIIQDADKSRNSMYQQNIMGYFTSTYSYVIEPGDTLSRIAATFYEKGKGYCDFDIIPENTKDLPQGVFTGSPLMENSRACLWPLIAVLTYNYWSQGTTANIPYENMVNMKNPDMIHVGKRLMIPVIPSFEVLAQCKEVFKYAYYAWPSDAAFPQYAGWGNVWYKLYQYLGGTF